MEVWIETADVVDNCALKTQTGPMELSKAAIL